MGCLSDAEIFALARGAPGAAERARLQAHLEGCADCRLRAAQSRAFLDEAAPTAHRPSDEEHLPSAGTIRDAEARAAAPTLAPGALVSRYVIEERLGSGGGGTVYRAWDPQLRRKVALKLLRPTSSGSLTTAQAHTRLLREAQAMAQLAHPNVVPVYDAGTFGDDVFIVMELVEGETLSRWLRREPRPWRDVVRLFAAAGRGLAAAHAAQIVHRDVKPKNVLLGPDGRPRVTDFGLARPFGLRPPPSERPPPVDGGAARDAGAEPAVAITALAGTPSYMAPEQFEGKPADARTDQFGFCVSLYVALCGYHPFSGRPADDLSMRVLARRVTEGHALAPPESLGLPERLVAALMRGLSVDPAARHPSMAALLDALADPTEADGSAAVAAPSRRARIALALAAMGAIAGGIGWRALSVPRCGDGRAERGEECDDGNRSDADGCLATCRFARCGDGKVRAGAEECDDGNARDGDGCSATCLACRAGDAAFVWDSTGHCYSRHDRPLPWPAARAACHAAGGRLVTYNNTYESRAVFSALFAPLPARPPSWIGLFADPAAPAGSFEWVTREPIAKHWWAEGEPRPLPGPCVFETPVAALGGAAGIVPGANWATADCQRPLPFVCERAGWSVRPSNNHAYRIFPAPSRWRDAAATCRALGGHLASVTEPEEQVFAAAQGVEGFWIGANDARREGTFEWTTGEPFVFRAFAPGEPDDKWDTDDCVFFGPDRLWHDRICDQLHPFMCEVD